MGTFGGASKAQVYNSIGINQLPVSAARWQQGSHVCFATLYMVKNNKKFNNSVTTDGRKK
jgi:hypothetical protein